MTNREKLEKMFNDGMEAVKNDNLADTSIQVMAMDKFVEIDEIKLTEDDYK